MARVHAKDTDIFVDEFQFDDVINSVSIDVTTNNADVTAFADGDSTFVEGSPGFTFDYSGLWDGTSGYDAEMFVDLTTVDRRVGVYPRGATDGEFGFEGQTIPGAQARTGGFSQVVALNVAWKGTEPIIRSQVLDNVSAVTATTTGVKYNFGAVSATQKVVGIVRLLSAPGGSGSNNLVITIESDANASAGSETTRLTFTTINQASVALFEVKEAAGAFTDAWWRVVGTYSGGGSREFTYLVVIGIIDLPTT
jgi:hypothetical protein